MEIQSGGIASISYDEESKNLINMRNQAPCWSGSLRAGGLCSGSVARGMEAAGSNAHGSTAGFYGHGCRRECGRRFYGEQLPHEFTADADEPDGRKPVMAEISRWQPVRCRRPNGRSAKPTRAPARQAAMA